MSTLTVLIVIFFTSAVNSSKILCVLPVPSYSHYEAPNQLMMTLAERGHEVTVISPYPAKTTHKNYRNFTVNIETVLSDKSVSLFDILRAPLKDYIKFLFNFGLQIAEGVFKDENVKNMMESKEETFDAVIIGEFFTDSLYALCHKYKAPCILYTPLMSIAFIDWKIANPTPLSYMSDFYIPYSDQMTFFQRLYSCIMYWYARFKAQTFLYPKHEELIKKYFGLDLQINDLIRNTSLVLRNSHLAFNGAVPTVPNMVEIGGFHLKHSQGIIDKDLKKYLDDAKDGVVYFSMGSILKSTMLSKDKLRTLLRVLGKLGKKVLWKYEDDTLPGLPQNVKIVKWAPQNDVLAHPNVKLFITHGGAFSLIESINYKVPVVGIPIFGDQVANMMFCESRKLGRSVNFEELTEGNLLDAVTDVLTQPSYTENVNLQSRILQDSPISQLDKAIYYIEYIIKYKGAPQLRVAAMNFRWYHQYSLDIILFIISTLIISIFVIYKCVNIICKRHFHEKVE